MSRMILRTLQLPKTCMRTFASSEESRFQEKLRKLKEKQMYYQSTPDIPIYLKEGLRDQIIYYSTITFTFLGLIMSLHGVYKIMKKN